MYVTTYVQINQLTALQVVRLCGNNEERIFKVARLTAGLWNPESWYVAAMAISDHLNESHPGNPEGTLHSYLEAAAI
jgi:hypothetical protein